MLKNYLKLTTIYAIELFHLININSYYFILFYFIILYSEYFEFFLTLLHNVTYLH